MKTLCSLTSRDSRFSLRFLCCGQNILPLASDGDKVRGSTFLRNVGNNLPDCNAHRRISVARAVSRWLPTAAVRVRARVWSSWICGGQCGAGAGFLLVIRFPLPIFIPPNSPSSQSPGARSIGQQMADLPSGPSMDSTPHYAN
jgi:hypothetical protein